MISQADINIIRDIVRCYNEYDTMVMMLYKIFKNEIKPAHFIEAGKVIGECSRPLTVNNKINYN